MTISTLVSVIIPAYNGVSRYLDQAIESVLSQTFNDFEFIIIDDASTDGTHKLVPNDPRVTYYRRHKNGGAPVARNDGAKLAKGEFLAFLDQDDLWEPTFLEETLDTIQSLRDVALVHTDGYTNNVRNEVLNYIKGIKHAKDMSLLLILSKGHKPHPDGILFRKTHFDAVNGWDEKLRIWEDVDLGIRLIQKYPVAHLPKPLYRNRRYAHSASSGTHLEQALFCRQYFLGKHAHLCQKDADLKEALQFEWARLYSDMGKYYLSQNQRTKSRRLFLQSLKLAPFSRISRRTILRYLRSYVPSFPKTSFGRFEILQAKTHS